MRPRIGFLLGAQRRPRLTMRGALVLLIVFLTIGPTLSFAIGIPLSLANGYVGFLISGQSPDGGPGGKFFWMNLLISPLTITIGLPFYGWWATTNLAHVAGWVACWVILVASSSRGLRVRDASSTAAAAVLAFPFLIDADGPHLSWGYPDAVFMSLAAAGGAAACVAIVRGLGEAGMRKRIAWGWLS